MPVTLVKPVQAQVVVKHSRFLAWVAPVPDRAAARSCAAELRARHPDAAHCCWACLAGGASAAVDDGEPSGTAGRPMLEILRLRDLDAVVAVVIRYFGGIKLGAGGLIRAYGGAVAAAIATAETTLVVPRLSIVCRFDYAHEGAIRAALAFHAAVITAGRYATHVEFECSVGVDRCDALRQAIADLSDGRAEFTACEQ